MDVYEPQLEGAGVSAEFQAPTGDDKLLGRLYFGAEGFVESGILANGTLVDLGETDTDGDGNPDAVRQMSFYKGDITDPSKFSGEAPLFPATKNTEGTVYLDETGGVAQLIVPGDRAGTLEVTIERSGAGGDASGFKREDF
jgi:hypothetical protein